MMTEIKSFNVSLAYFITWTTYIKPSSLKEIFALEQYHIFVVLVPQRLMLVLSVYNDE